MVYRSNDSKNSMQDQKMKNKSSSDEKISVIRWSKTGFASFELYMVCQLQQNILTGIFVCLRYLFLKIAAFR